MTTDIKMTIEIVDIECPQNGSNDLGRALHRDNDFTDVTLVCNDGQRLDCHRSVLATSSEFLRRLLVQSDQKQVLLFLGPKVGMEEVRVCLQS